MKSTYENLGDPDEQPIRYRPNDPLVGEQKPFATNSQRISDHHSGSSPFYRGVIK